MRLCVEETMLERAKVSAFGASLRNIKENNGNSESQNGKYIRMKDETFIGLLQKE